VKNRQPECSSAGLFTAVLSEAALDVLYRKAAQPYFCEQPSLLAEATVRDVLTAISSRVNDCRALQWS